MDFEMYTFACGYFAYEVQLAVPTSERPRKVHL